MSEAMICIGIVGKYKEIPFWKREKIWSKSDDKGFAEELVEWTKKRMAELQRE